MSEYQYYEWQTVDRTLTSKERSAVDGLSSHMTTSAAGAWVDYSWGDFKHEPLAVLGSYFDAFIYMANWGSHQLAFRFPVGLIEPAQIQPYLVDSYSGLEKVGDSYILNFELYGEDPPGVWVEDEGQLDSLVPLRKAILAEDYRVLYLAWMRAIELQYEDEDRPNPPVPAGLEQLTEELKAFADFFEISQSQLKAAAKASAALPKTTEIDVAAAIEQLSREECNDFLLRLAGDEPHLSLALRKRLRELAPK